MRSIKRTIDGFTFGFVYGDAFGMDGLVIPTDIDITSQDKNLAAALVKAQQASVAFFCVCFASEWADVNYKLEHSSEEDLRFAWRHAVAAESQPWWDIDEFGERARKSITWVIENVPKEIERRKATPKPINVHKPKGGVKGTEGYVYVLQSPTGAYKIGRTRDPENRLKTFTVKLPFEVEYTRVFFSPDMFKLEKTIHENLADKRINGEWFNLTAEDIANIERWAF